MLETELVLVKPDQSCFGVDVSDLRLLKKKSCLGGEYVEIGSILDATAEEVKDFVLFSLEDVNEHSLFKKLKPLQANKEQWLFLLKVLL